MIKVTVSGTDKPKLALDCSNRPNYILVDDYDNDVEISYNKLEFITSNFWKTCYASFLERLKEYLIHNLSELGFTFNSESEFLEFMKNRVTRITTCFNSNYELYLDIDNSEKCKLIGVYSDSIEFQQTTGVISGAYVLKIGKI